MIEPLVSYIFGYTSRGFTASNFFVKTRDFYVAYRKAGSEDLVYPCKIYCFINLPQKMILWYIVIRTPNP